MNRTHLQKKVHVTNNIEIYIVQPTQKSIITIFTKILIIICQPSEGLKSEKNL